MTYKNNALLDASLMLGRAATSVSPWVPSVGPMRAKDIKKSWLQKQLASGFAGAELLSTSLIGGDFNTTGAAE